MANVKRTNRSAPKIVDDHIERPHGGKGAVKQVGAQTGLERQALRGPTNPAGSGSVEQIGPSTIRNTASGRGSVEIIGKDSNREDSVGLYPSSPDARQEGSVEVIGPNEAAYAALVSKPRGPNLKHAGYEYGIKHSNVKSTSTPLLISGVGVAHEWGKKAEVPGTMKGGIKGVGPSTPTTDVLISGRRVTFGPEYPEPLEGNPVKSVVGGVINDSSFGSYGF